MTPDTITMVSICTDCYFYSHYGADSLSDYITPSMEQDIKQGFDKLGNVHIADHHGDDCGFLAQSPLRHDPDILCVCDEAYFSWSPCEICGSNLGGNRHDVDIIEMGG